jgi:hypothetical protein
VLDVSWINVGGMDYKHSRRRFPGGGSQQKVKAVGTRDTSGEPGTCFLSLTLLENRDSDHLGLIQKEDVPKRMQRTIVNASSLAHPPNADPQRRYAV